MSHAREKILATIRRSLKKPLGICAERLVKRPRGTLPAIAKQSHEGLIKLFIDQAKKSSAVVEVIESRLAIPDFIKFYLQQQSLPLELRVAKNVPIEWIDSELVIHDGAALESDRISVTPALCGVAETGTLVLTSSADSPTTLNFLPEIHIVLLSKSKIVAYYEDAWDLVRAEKNVPRTVNFITGPSRTGDIEQQVMIGIHGPKQLLILLYE